MARIAEVQSQAASESKQTGSQAKMVKEEVNIGSEKWFAETVGLPNWGINPLWDLYHVKNIDLFDAF